MSSAASSADFEFFGMWWRIWSSMSSAIRLLIAPREAARRRRISEHCSSPLRALSTDSSCPMTFLVRFTKSNFSREVCDILLDYPIRWGIQGMCLPTGGRVQGATTLAYMEMKPQEPEPPGSSSHLELRDWQSIA